MSRMLDIATVLATHEIVGVSGGTATGAWWSCRCGETDVVRGTRDHAAAKGREHVAAAIEMRVP